MGETCLLSDQESERSSPEEDGEAKFDGLWNERGVISGDMLTWQDGPTTRLVITSGTSLVLMLGGGTYKGELVADGALHWDDGDVWTRQSCFDGHWGNRGFIRGTTLVWNDGPATPIVITDRQTLEVKLDGQVYSGELRADGQLHWDDGDVWVRHVLSVGDRIKARAGAELTQGDDEFFKAGDEGRVTQIGEKTFDIAWERTGLSSAYFLGSWAQAFVLVPDSPLGGFSMFDKVRWSNGQLGNIVGFNKNMVDVKFQQGIFKCLPEDLEQGVGIAQEMSDAGASKLYNAVVRTHQPRVREATDGVTGPSTRKQKATPLDGACKQSVAVPAAMIKASRAAPPGVEAVPPRASAEAPLDSKVYHGHVTWSRGSMAWLSCESLTVTYPGCDVFLHKNDCNVMPKQYDRVSFRLTLDPQGNPKAVKAIVETPKTKTEPEMISARDWFSSGSKRRGQ